MRIFRATITGATLLDAERSMQNSATPSSTPRTAARLLGGSNFSEAALPKAILDRVGCPMSRWRTRQSATPAFERPICGRRASRGRSWRAVSFQGATLIAACFITPGMDSCDFSKSDITAAQFIRARADEDTRFVCGQRTGRELQQLPPQVLRFHAGRLSAQRDSMQGDLSGSQFDHAVFRHADLREAQLGGVILYRADLTGARFAGAMLLAADLRGADLSGAHELTAHQLTQARTDDTTILPNGSRGPYRGIPVRSARRPIVTSAAGSKHVTFALLAGRRHDRGQREIQLPP